MSPIVAQSLKPENLPLTGCHLIEASAGTGKTYNITRIYLRLLLERQLDVKNILVMTFTRAATEELRGRIAKEIRNALENWGQFEPDDDFFRTLTQRFDQKSIYPILHNALLHLDEAAIFTIHGFCKRVLSQQAFSSGVSFNVQMEADTVELELEAIRDWYRSLSQNAELYPVLTQKWSTPEHFRQAFKEILSSSVAIEVKTAESILNEYYLLNTHCLTQLQSHQSDIFFHLIDSHKDKDIRSLEWHDLLHWLKCIDASDGLPDSMPKSISQFFNGNRFSRKAPEIKQQLTDVFAPLNQLKAQSEKIAEVINKARSYQLAAEGINRIREKITQAKQQARIMNYDDLIQQLAASLQGDSQMHIRLAQKIREQYPVALVDEFQDTDPNQYEILKAIYQTGSSEASSNSDKADNTALYMIGDPKQAIYAFRSGDVFTYLSAREDARYHWIMDTNWRSSSEMVNAYNRLFYGAPINEAAQDVFGFDIAYTPVKSSGKADQSPLNDEQHEEALQFIYFPFNEQYQVKRSKKQEVTQDFCLVIAQWCSSEIERLLSSATKIGDRILQEQDIAILVRDKTEAAYVQDALRQAGYPSVYLSTHDNVFASEEAIELERMLVGILELENDSALIAALSTRFMSCDSVQLYELQEDEDLWERYREQIFDLREIWLKRGFMAMALKLLHHNYIPEPEFHERSLTNTLQLLELLQQASQRHQQPEQLLNWFREQLESQSADTEAELRLESDANLLRIITQHGSKGLEYPVVFIPFASRYKDPTKFGSRTIDLFKYHDRESRQLQYFMGQDRIIAELYSQESWAESIRLLYVAITRAEHRCYICATPFSQHHLSPLGQTLKLRAGDDLDSALQSLVQSEAQAIYLREVDALEFNVSRSQSADNEMPASLANFHGRIERNWWLSSFSALTRNLRHGGISTPDRDQDDSVQTVTGTMDEQALRFYLSKGAAAGNLLHDILEHTDFLMPQWERSMERPLARFSETLNSQQQSELGDWMQEVLDTILDSDSDLSLGKLGWSQTLRETEFYFPMEQVKLESLGRVLKRHRVELSENTGNQRFQLPGHQLLKGMMHGFIDLIFQWQDRFYIADYKSTHLGHSLEHYHVGALEKNIRDNYYDLQYLLYCLALHRYLKTRLSHYDPEQHFGGVYYFYLRGMKDNNKHGVYYTPIKPELLDELDRLFSNVRDEVVDHVS